MSTTATATAASLVATYRGYMRQYRVAYFTVSDEAAEVYRTVAHDAQAKMSPELSAAVYAEHSHRTILFEYEICGEDHNVQRELAAACAAKVDALIS